MYIDGPPAPPAPPVPPVGVVPPTETPVDEIETAEHEVHLPPLTIWPVSLALSLTVAGLGLVTMVPISFFGLAFAIYSIVQWIQELRHEYDHPGTH